MSRGEEYFLEDIESFHAAVSAAAANSAAVSASARLRGGTPPEQQQPPGMDPAAAGGGVPLRELIWAKHGHLHEINRSGGPAERRDAHRRRWLVDMTRLSADVAAALQAWAMNETGDTCAAATTTGVGPQSTPLRMEDTFVTEESATLQSYASRRDSGPRCQTEIGNGTAAEGRAEKSVESKRYSVFIRDFRTGHASPQRRGVHSKQRTGESHHVQQQQREGKANVSSQRNRHTLLFLGAVMYEIYSGISPDEGQSLMEHGGAGADTSLENERASDDNNTASHSAEQNENVDYDDAPLRKRTLRQHILAGGGCGNGSSGTMAYPPLTHFGLPPSIATMVSCLLDQSVSGPSGKPIYDKVSDLIQDLLVLCNDPDRFLFDLSSNPTEALLLSYRLPDLPPPGRLYGREQQLLTMNDAFTSFVSGLSCKRSGTSRAVLISGQSGTGKTSLAGQLRQPTAALGGFFLSGKFDQTEKGRPLSTICAAFEEFCDLVLVDRSPEDTADIRRAVSDAVGSDSKLLTSLIPDLSGILLDAPLDDESSAPEAIVEGKQARNRLKFVFRKMVRSMCSPSRPVLLFLDDLHWADPESLDLVNFLVTDAENSCLLLVGCYRDNEVGPDDSPLSDWMKGLGGAGVGLTQIHLGNVSRDDINALISEALRLPPGPVRSLSDALYRKTQGNLFFVVQFIQSLHEEGLLSFSLISRRWVWDAIAIESKDVVADALGLMMMKMLKLPAAELRALQVASCFGHQCDEPVLRMMESGAAAGSDIENVAEHLNVAVNDGFMVKIGPLYRFAHDQIEKAAYSLATQAEMNVLHLSIGRAILRGASKAEVDEIIFVAVDQVDKGQDLITDDLERIEIVRLNLRAGKKSIASSAFLPASVFLQEGMRALRIDDWDVNYELCLEMYSSCAETLYALGYFASLHTVLDVVFARGRSLHDKCRAYHTLVKALHAQGKTKDALVTSVRVLAQLGVSFPAQLTEGIIEDEFIETNEMLEGTTMDLIRNRGVMQDRDKLAAMQFLNSLQLLTFWGKHSMGHVVTFRMVQLSLEYGVCKESALGFASLAASHCSNGDIQNGKRFAKLAIHLLERFNARDCLPHVYSAVYGFVADFYQPLQAGRVSHLRAYEVGMSCGDVMWAMMNAVQYISKCIHSGYQLDELVGQIKAFMQQMKEHNLPGPLAQIRLRLQFVLNLIQPSKDPTELSGDAMNQDEFISAVRERQQFTILNTMYMVCIYLAYLFGKHEVAADIIENSQVQDGNRVKSAFRISFESFYMPLVAIAVLDENNRRCKWRRMAKDGIVEMKAWAALCPWNFQHKYELLVAEMAFREGDIQTAAMTFEKAIKSAADHHFVHEQAMACERAAIFSSAIGNTITASDYYRQSYDLYMQWGARQKAQDVMGKLGGIE